jgi:hypothetical protein
MEDVLRDKLSTHSLTEDNLHPFWRFMDPIFRKHDWRYTDTVTHFLLRCTNPVIILQIHCTHENTYAAQHEQQTSWQHQNWSILQKDIWPGELSAMRRWWWWWISNKRRVWEVDVLFAINIANKPTEVGVDSYCSTNLLPPARGAVTLMEPALSYKGLEWYFYRASERHDWHEGMGVFCLAPTRRFILWQWEHSLKFLGQAASYCWSWFVGQQNNLNCCSSI